MSLTVDQALAELREIAAALEPLEPGDPSRAALESRRDELRLAARRAADGARNPVALERELASLEARLTGLEREKIKPAWIEHRNWVNNPSAYSGHINKLLESATESDRQTIEVRIAELRERLFGDSPSEPDQADPPETSGD